ncbi:thiamine phosphate synthase [candidate division LCP-89 bacterium B3_LCP]|uniref:Thiamine-phosphate synthase n=1 Tax=candidate division LCP-89 bacterium B3_LCP TaxID=2012998 RepID=A0A532V296_UNCL8|nr:MAG: thiamine phosphate synthase [candidate division LCP-89 bacterium B3_LCP]
MVPKDNSLNFDLYPVTCEKLSNGRTNLEVLDELIAGGAKVVQLREKDLSDRDFFELATEFRRRTFQAGMTLIINDRVDICRAVEADGVHLGQDDFPLKTARRMLGPQTIIGVSTHSIEEAVQAEKEGADYINVGPIFATQTKEHTGTPVGIELFRKVNDLVNIPITVMGGIKLENLQQVLDAGVKRVAVVTGIISSDDIAIAVREFRRRITEVTVGEDL